ncbi:DUF998 domain-containing protein [Microbacterium paludicola]|uniref:DUF998 domain-containing protein n=1 Tax=Microbacterium paludicola TaxID=300019 RepID=UPI0021B50AC9|nr:DUF998 domain-containing protein [Microbacterium paludicola]
MGIEERMTRETRAVWATVVCFLLGSAAGTLALWGNPRPVAGDGSVGLPAGIIAGVIAAASFVVSSRVHRRNDHAEMPRWQVRVSTLSAIALTVAFAGVTALGVLLAGEVLGVGLQGAEIPPLGGGIVTGVASAVAGRLTFSAGIDLRTSDLATLLFSYLLIGTLFAMLTAADPRWWETNFSQLGIGAGAWAFNGTLVVSGVLVATVGSYIGRDLHRALGDRELTRIARVVALWASAGIALAGIGVVSLEDAVIAHNIIAFAALVLFVAAAAVTTAVMPGPPRPLVIATVLIAAVLVIAVVTSILGACSVTVLEAIVIGLALLWMTTLVRVLAVLAPTVTRPSRRATLLPR